MELQDSKIYKFKEVIIFYRKYINFYKKKFTPITEYEVKDRKQLLKDLEFFRIIAFIGAYTMGYSMKKIMMMVREQKTISSVSSFIVPSLVTGLIGYFIGSFLGMRMIFNKTEYLRLRIYYEKSIGFDRSSVKEMFSDYPFANKVEYLLDDNEVKNGIVKRKKQGDKDMGQDAYYEKFNFSNKKRIFGIKSEKETKKVKEPEVVVSEGNSNKNSVDFSSIDSTDIDDLLNNKIKNIK